MKKNIILLSVLFLGINYVNAQQVDNTNYKRNSYDISSNLFITPEVSQFQKSTFFESNNYTGKIDLKIPIYNVKYGDISVPIYLSYNSSGVKLDDISSDVGLGWSLIAGGNIIRNIKDVEDHTFTIGSYGREDWDIGWEPFQFASEVGYHRNIGEVFNSNPSSGHIEGDYEELAKTDASPDLFYISAPNVNSSFYLTKKANLNEYNAVQLSGKELLFDTPNIGSLEVDEIGFDNRTIRGIEGLHNFMSTGGNPIGTPIQIKDHYRYGFHDFKQFEFKNTDGNRYKFAHVDLIENIANVLNLGKSVWGIVPAYLTTRFGYKSFPTTWHLSEIKDFNNNKVEFNYDKYSNPHIKRTREKSNDSYRYLYNPFNDGNSSTNCNIGLYPTFKEIRNGVIISNSGEVREDHYKAQEFYSIQRQRNRLSQIKWENNTIDFVYSLNRKDNPNEKSLDEIIVRSGSTIIKKIKLHYSYFNASTNCNEWECYRLKLDKIEEIDLNNKPINNYTFDYYYDNPLPKVHSSQQDFLGYYNNNGVEQSNDLDNKVPILYFHKNQGRFSILPFQRNDGTFTKVIPGQFSLEPNNNSLTSLLKKVTFPTGGSSEFEYENHKFLFNGIEYLAGGARIKKQILNELGSTRILNYDYTDNGKSSGFINNIPIYGQIWGFDKNDINKMSFVSFDKPKNEIELTDGAFVGYSKVKIHEQGNGVTEYNFTNAKEFPNEEIKNINSSFPTCINTLHQNSSFPNVAYIDNDVKRGKLTSKNVYNSSNVLIQSQTNEYKHTIFNEEIISFQRFINNYYDDPYYTRPQGITTNYENKLRVERNLLSKQETKEYLDGGVVTNTKEITYDAIYPFVKQEKTKNSKSETLTTEYQYPSDWAGNPIYDKLIAQNRISEPITSVQKLNTNTVVSAVYNEYYDFNGIVQKSRIFQKKGSNQFVEGDDVIAYNSYDNYGNITQYTSKNGIPVAIIWGYGGQYPVLKVEGATYAEVMTKFDSGALGAINNGSITATSFDAYRPLFPNAMITSYTYKPLVGVTSITAPNGQTETYNYDASNRLKSIVNDKGEVLKTFEYNYKQP